MDLEKSINLKQSNNIELNDVFVYAASINDLNIVKYFIERGTKISRKNDMALLLAAQNGHLDMYKYLVEFGIKKPFLTSSIFAQHINICLALVGKNSNSVEFNEYLNSLII